MLCNIPSQYKNSFTVQKLIHSTKTHTHSTKTPSQYKNPFTVQKLLHSTKTPSQYKNPFTVQKPIQSTKTASQYKNPLAYVFFLQLQFIHLYFNNCNNLTHFVSLSLTIPQSAMASSEILNAYGKLLLKISRRSQSMPTQSRLSTTKKSPVVCSISQERDLDGVPIVICRTARRHTLFFNCQKSRAFVQNVRRRWRLISSPPGRRSRWRLIPSPPRQLLFEHHHVGTSKIVHSFFCSFIHRWVDTTEKILIGWRSHRHLQNSEATHVVFWNFCIFPFAEGIGSLWRRKDGNRGGGCVVEPG